MEYLDLRPDCVYSDAYYHARRFPRPELQPRLDQMQHRSVDDPSSHRPHKLGMWNAIEVAAEIRIHNLPMTRVDQHVDVLDCVQRAAVRPIGILLRLQVGLEDGFEDQHWPPFAQPDPGLSVSLTVSASHPAWVCKPAAQAAVDRFDSSALASVRPTIVPCRTASMFSNVWLSTPAAPPLAWQRS